MLSHSDLRNVAGNEFNDPENKGMAIHNHLEHPGSVQWYYLDARGSYLIGLDENSWERDFALQVYRPGNFSVPLKSYGETFHPTELPGDPGATVIGKKWLS